MRPSSLRRDAQVWLVYSCSDAQRGMTVYAEEDARAALEAMRAAEEAARRPPTPPEPTHTERSALSPTDSPTESTIIANSARATKAKPGAVKKKGGKPKMTAKEKRERGLELERILAGLPLEFRGDDPNLRRHIEAVIEKFLDNPGEGFSSMSFHPVCCTRTCSNRTFYAVIAFVKPPDLNQARVNKCLIALVNRKIVRKDNRTVSDHIVRMRYPLTRPSGSCLVSLERTSSMIFLHPYRHCIWYSSLFVTLLKRRGCIELTAIFLQLRPLRCI